MIKAVIFDLDGTLADSIHSIEYSMNQALQECGYRTFPEREYKYFVGDGVTELLKRVLHAAGDEKETGFDQLRASYERLFERHCMYRVAPYEGITEMLEQLKQMGIKLAVLSNKPHERTKDVIGDLFCEGLFDLVIGQSEEIRRKPSPDGVYLIAEKFQIPLSEICYVGDTNTDMQTGKSAGVWTIGVLWGFRDREELEANHADRIIAVPEELTEMIKEKDEEKTDHD